MARPRKNQEGPSARERIVEAFWQLMGEAPYADVTIRGLCARAQVNPNTFYRYFECMDELAQRAFQENLDPGFPALLMRLVTASSEGGSARETVSDIGIEPRLERMQLFARSGSSALVGLVHDAIRDAWLSSLGRRLEDLGPDELADFTAIIGAVMALFSSRDPAFGLHELTDMAGRPLGSAMVTTLATMRQMGDGDGPLPS